MALPHVTHYEAEQVFIPLLSVWVHTLDISELLLSYHCALILDEPMIKIKISKSRDE